MNDRVGRVVIPLDVASEGATAIETAARLAARANAPLHGIFVEDQDLLSVANLPFARQVTLGRGTEPLTIERVRASSSRERPESTRPRRWHLVFGFLRELIRYALPF